VGDSRVALPEEESDKRHNKHNLNDFIDIPNKGEIPRLGNIPQWDLNGCIRDRGDSEAMATDTPCVQEHSPDEANASKKYRRRSLYNTSIQVCYGCDA
jgi:hypothetical protein